jgi:hypothetical protein
MPDDAERRIPLETRVASQRALTTAHCPEAATTTSAALRSRTARSRARRCSASGSSSPRRSRRERRWSGRSVGGDDLPPRWAERRGVELTCGLLPERPRRDSREDASRAGGPSAGSVRDRGRGRRQLTSVTWSTPSVGGRARRGLLFPRRAPHPTETKGKNDNESRDRRTLRPTQRKDHGRARRGLVEAASKIVSATPGSRSRKAATSSRPCSASSTIVGRASQRLT